jgi:hypothetical protein
MSRHKYRRVCTAVSKIFEVPVALLTSIYVKSEIVVFRLEVDANLCVAFEGTHPKCARPGKPKNIEDTDFSCRLLGIVSWYNVSTQSTNISQLKKMF